MGPTAARDGAARPGRWLRGSLVVAGLWAGYAACRGVVRASRRGAPGGAANQVKAVIFDVDGTLVDSVDLHAHAWVDAFQEFGYRVRFDQVRRQIGKGADQLMPVFLPDATIDAIGKDLQERRAGILKQRYLSQVTPFRKARALLQRVGAGGMIVALASSASKEELRAYKRIAGIENLVDAETSSSDAERSKPHGDIFVAVLDKLPGVHPSEAIVVGDTPYDARAARKAGLRTVGLLCGGWPEADLRQAGCIAVYNDPADLLARFDSSPLAAARGSNRR